MNLIVPFKKRHFLVVIAIVAGLSTSWVAAQDRTAVTTDPAAIDKSARGKKVCPLPEKYAEKKSGEQPEPKQDVCHNGHTIRIPQSAVTAHQKHGDTLGPCGSPGKGK